MESDDNNINNPSETCVVVDSEELLRILNENDNFQYFRLLDEVEQGGAEPMEVEDGAPITAQVQV